MYTKILKEKKENVSVSAWIEELILIGIENKK